MTFLLFFCCSRSNMGRLVDVTEAKLSKPRSPLFPIFERNREYVMLHESHAKSATRRLRRQVRPLAHPPRKAPQRPTHPIRAAPFLCY